MVSRVVYFPSRSVLEAFQNLRFARATTAYLTRGSSLLGSSYELLNHH
jgi:hypothetical protein